MKNLEVLVIWSHWKKKYEIREFRRNNVIHVSGVHKTKENAAKNLELYLKRHGLTQKVEVIR